MISLWLPVDDAENPNGRREGLAVVWRERNRLPHHHCAQDQSLRNPGKRHIFKNMKYVSAIEIMEMFNFPISQYEML